MLVRYVRVLCLAMSITRIHLPDNYSVVRSQSVSDNILIRLNLPYQSLLYRNFYIEENVLLVAYDCDNHRLRCTPPLWWLLKLLLDNG